jgi:hypothetical protein
LVGKEEAEAEEEEAQYKFLHDWTAYFSRIFSPNSYFNFFFNL